MEIRKSLIFTFLFSLPPSLLLAQSINEQVWVEYMGNFSMANVYNLENAFSYSTLLNSPKWRDYSYSATLEWSPTPLVEPLAQLVVTYTNQTDSYNSVEIRPVIGSRFYFTPNRRIQTRLLVRLEQRNFKNLDGDAWTVAYRPRIRAEMIIPISQDSYYKDNLWYGLADAEMLFATDDVKERFANRFRVRLGIGYRLNYSFRFEFVYMNQQSRNTITDTFGTSDNIFRFRIKHYLRKSKPSKASGTGN